MSLPHSMHIQISPSRLAIISFSLLDLALILKAAGKTQPNDNNSATALCIYMARAPVSQPNADTAGAAVTSMQCE